jgi:hypothetical protein
MIRKESKAALRIMKALGAATRADNVVEWRTSQEK